MQINSHLCAGLEDQLLGRVILTERKELETEKMQLVADVTANNKKIKELEANLLHKLATVQVSLILFRGVDVFVNNFKENK